MTIPTFSPATNPSYEYTESRALVTDRVGLSRGYEEERRQTLRPLRRVALQWEALGESDLEYIQSFLDSLEGSRGPFYWTPIEKVPSPSAILPTLGQVSGGSLSSRTIYVVSTWYDATYGETRESGRSSLAVDANKYLTVSIPVLPARVGSWRVYASTSSGSECLQATVTGSRTWTQSAALSTGTASPPAANSLNPPAKWMIDGDVSAVRFGPGAWRVSLPLAEVFV